MNRLQIKLIIFLMSVSLVGIIAVQLLWIKNAIEVKEAQFDRATFEAMNETIRKLESYDAAHYISNKIKIEGPEDYNTVTLVSADSLFDIKLNDSVFNQILFIAEENEDEQFKANVVVSSSSSDTSTYKLRKDGSVWTSSSITHHPNTENITLISDSIDVQLLKSNRRQIGYRVTTISNAVKQLVYEYATEDESIKNRLNLTNVEKIISAELKHKKLPEKFDYAIMNDDSELEYILKSENFHDADLQSKYKVNVFPHDLNQKSNFFILSFTDKKAHLFNSILLLSIGSLVFIVIIIITFSFTIYIILRQKKISEIKTDFINNMTHEFKTPIATISLATDSINNPKIIGNNEQVRFYTGIIKEENRRMNAQVENILQMSLIDKKELELNIKPYDVNSLLKKAIQNIKLHVEEKDGSIDASLNASKTTIAVDEVHFINMINNLLDNAIKYTEGSPRILISTADYKNEIQINIKDNGMGMSDDKLNKIFDKFYRVQMGNIHNIKGFGLGLSYVKAVLETFKGRIEVKSELGKGSIFTIYLPIQ